MGYGAKIQSLNQAIAEALPHMKNVAGENPNAQVLVRAITFSDGAQWHVSVPTPIEDFRWAPLSAGGLTDMGKALTMVAEQLTIPPMSERALPPVLVLISDGQPTDDFTLGLSELMSRPWGRKAVRIAIAIGEDADLDCLQKFVSHSELKPLRANNVESLTSFIKWASTAVLKAASSPASQLIGANAPVGNVPIPAPPDPVASVDSTDVW
jgi:uncharacterized protein YegL